MFRTQKSQESWVKNNRKLAVLLIIFIIALLGGVYDFFYLSGKFSADVITVLPDRTVKLNSYNTFGPIKTADEVKLLAQRDRIVMSEGNWYNISNIKTNIDYPNGFNSATLKSINPSAKTFVYYPLDVKGGAEEDSWLAEGAPTSVTATTLIDSSKNWTLSYWTNRYLWITEGTGKDQIIRISANTANTLTLATNFTTLPDSTSKYAIISGATPQNPTIMRSPISYSSIEKNDWWFRDGNGNIVYEGTPTISANKFIDVGAAGFKEEYLTTMLSRLKNKNYDGVVLDYWWPKFISARVVEKGYTVPTKYKVASGDPDALWFQNAWQPFVQYVVAGLHANGYKVIGNVAGEYNTTSTYEKWQRSILDGTVYEQWAVGWRGEWLSGETIANRINSFRDDNLDTWAADFGLRADNGDYDIASSYATDTTPAQKTIGQSFILFYDHLKKVNITFKRVGSRSDYGLNFSIYESDANGLPTGTPITQVSVGSAFINQIGDKTSLDVNFGNIALTNGKKYVLTMEQSGQDSSNYVAIWRSGDRVNEMTYLEYNSSSDAWVADQFHDLAMTFWASGEQQRADVALAMYYIAIPQNAADPTMRTLNFAYNQKPFWEAGWDLNIGKPTGAYTKDSTHYLWNRDFENGKVILNYDSVNLQTTLSKEYTDATGTSYSGTITIPAHSGLVLKAVANLSPTISITSPSNSSNVSNAVTLASTISGVTSLQSIKYYLDDSVLLGVSTTAPYSVSWNSKTVANGSHKISAQIISTASNILASTNINVTVNNIVVDTIAPIISIASPASGDSVARNSTQAITVNTTDNVGIAKVELYVNNTLLTTDTVSPYLFSWKVPGAKNKNYLLTAKSYDAAGNTASTTIKLIAK